LDICFHWLPPHRASQAHVAHQARNRASGDRDPFSVQLAPDLPDTIDLEVLIPDPLDLGPQLGIPLGALREL
jgi:hypothetical protein